MDVQTKILECLAKPVETCKCVEHSCSKSICQCVDVDIPIKVQPKAKIGSIEAECCGEPLVTCKEKCNDSCDFIISQKICVKISMKYDVTTKIGDGIIVCREF
ncbi:MAG: hypothetical protein RSB38_05025 [Oscillospiraceae bacterium]